MFIWLNTLPYYLHWLVVIIAMALHHPWSWGKRSWIGHVLQLCTAKFMGRRSARAAKNCRQSVRVFTPSWIICILLWCQSSLRRVLPSDRGHVSLTHIPVRPQLPSPRFSLQNPFSIRARCSKDPESLAAVRWDSHHSLNENTRGERRGRKKLQEERTSLIPPPPELILSLLFCREKHLFLRSGRVERPSSCEKMTWHRSCCLEF